MEHGLSLENTFSSIDDIIEKLESTEISFEESIKLYEQAMEMMRSCSVYLTEMEGFINKVVDPETGQWTEFNEKN